MSKESQGRVSKKPNIFCRIKDRVRPIRATRKGKATAVAIAVVVIAGVLLAIPHTRYAMLGPIIKKDVSFVVKDAENNKPVSGVKMMLGDVSSQSNADGVVRFENIPVGQYNLKAEKQYYKGSEQAITVPVFESIENREVSITAEGREVKVTVRHKLSGQTVSNATIQIGESTSLTDADGNAYLILPSAKDPYTAKISKAGYNDTTIEVVVEASDQSLDATLTPSGSVYFLSKRTGKINVMKSNLDGSGQGVLIEGTGSEIDTETVMFASRDWRYLALFARRDSEKPKLYVIDTKDASMVVADEGDAYFEMIGWADDRFVYKVQRNKQSWEPGFQSLKSYHAPTKKLSVLDDTKASGSSYWDYMSETITTPFIVGNNVVYAKYWSRSQFKDVGDNKSAIVVVGSDGANRKNIRQYAIPNNGEYGGDIGAKANGPRSIYFRVAGWGDGAKPEFYEYRNGELKQISNITDERYFNEFSKTYLVSPSGKKVFWHEPRDGRNVLFVGDENALNGRELGTDEYVPYGWFGDDYVLLSKKGSELYIMPADGKLGEGMPIKISDYHKSSFTYPGHGYGYGGQ